ncbi:MAG TPA: metallophosphoesterase [Blastocatellia bacterium]|nr:metallophosphoesterase [Blastocatellia bacterium]
MMRVYRRCSFTLIFVAIALMACASCSRGTQENKTGKKHREQARSVFVRDWKRFPAVIERDTKNEVVALGDVHGGYERLVSLLSLAGLIKPDGQSPVGYSWSGGNRLLICTGDLINKGDRSIEVIDLFRSIEIQAPASRGEVLITLGNHEAEFLANPTKKKATEFGDELRNRGIDPDTLTRGEPPYGEWLMNRPFAARINDWFFAHGGNTSGKTIPELSEGFRTAVDRGDWGSPFIIGDDSLLEAQEWWRGEGKAKDLLDGYLSALNCKHIVFGHDPSAFHNKGEIGQDKDGRIFLIDVGMSPAIDYSKGALLLIDAIGNEVVATSLDAEGRKREVWRETSSKRGQ